MARQLEELGALVLRIADAGEPFGRAAEDRRDDRDALDIVDRSRTAVEAGTGRERRLEARLALLALQAFEHRRLFAADVGARATVHEQVEVIARAAGVLADQTSLISLGNGALQDTGFLDEFAADIDIGGARAHREAGDQRALDQLVRIVADDLAVLAASGLGLIGVDDQEVGFAGLGLLGHEAPLHAGRETGTAAASQARRLDLLDDRVLADGEQAFGVVPVAAGARGLQPRLLETVDVGKDAVLVRKRPGVAHQKAPDERAMRNATNTTTAIRPNLIMPFTNRNARKTSSRTTRMATIVIACPPRPPG